MRAIILGDGAMGRALAELLRADGDAALDLRGRPAGGTHPALAFHGADVTFDFSRGDAVLANAAAAVAGGCRRLVIGATAWEGDRPAVEALLRETGASAVSASNFSPGVALFARLVEEAARLFGALDAYDPFILEWHRSTKADRPSGTAKELSRRLLAAHPRKRRLTDLRREDPPAPDELEVVSLRAGASPGMHLVGFDAPGETIELRLTARDRAAYASGAVAAARWLLAAPRSSSLHTFDEVLAELTDPTDQTGTASGPATPRTGHPVAQAGDPRHASRPAATRRPTSASPSQRAAQRRAHVQGATR